MKLRDDLKSHTRNSTALNCYVETAFAIDEPSNVLGRAPRLAFPADDLHSLAITPSDIEFSEIPQIFQHIAKFNDSSPFGYCLTTF